ncbi:hypothetical protein C8J26_3558 [Sphingomonas aurantiaca]|uniref:Uncharacterized protein n=1 Tax=Sphingomonas aurantiaca TaxID=185949 RepID=A0A2T5GH87_9SPHN|nr:hypothetical protein C8J26_3558 [Sphingomonas aurantiaca]
MTGYRPLFKALELVLYTRSLNGFHGVTDSTSLVRVYGGPYLLKCETHPDLPAKSLQILVLSITRSLIRLQVCGRSAISGLAK